MTIQEEIAANIDDVRQLLEDNRSLSVAYLGQRVSRLEDDVRAALKEQTKLLAENNQAKERLSKLERSMDKARELFRDISADVEAMRGKTND